MSNKELKKLLELSDKELARFSNRYKGYHPTIIQIEGGKTTTFTKEHAPDKFTKDLFDACKGFFDAWSSPKNCGKLIKTILGKGTKFYAKDEPLISYSDGAETYHVITPSGKHFKEYLNVYDFEAFVPLIRKIIKYTLKGDDI